MTRLGREWIVWGVFCSENLGRAKSNSNFSQEVKLYVLRAVFSHFDVFDHWILIVSQVTA